MWRSSMRCASCDVTENKTRPVGHPAEARTTSPSRTSRPELFQARFDLALGAGRIGGFDLRPQPIAAVNVGLQNFHLMVPHLIDHRSLQIRCSLSHAY